MLVKKKENGEGMEDKTRDCPAADGQSPILSTTITLDRLCKRGYESMLSVYEKITPSGSCRKPSRQRRDGVRGSPRQCSLAGQPTRLCVRALFSIFYFKN